MLDILPLREKTKKVALNPEVVQFRDRRAAYSLSTARNPGKSTVVTPQPTVIGPACMVKFRESRRQAERA
jgi:hypothetical protein